MIDIPTLNAAIWNRAKTDSAGADLRALLGAGATSVLRARQLSAKALPTRPLIALKRLPVGGESDEMRLAVWIWYIYDERDQDYWRINAIANALQALYPQWGAIPDGDVTTSIGDESDDPTLNLLMTPLRVLYRRRA